MEKPSEKILLTGDRPTGQLHLGHFVGSIQNRIDLQNKVDKAFYMVADIQALTDNFDNPQKVVDNVIEVAIDNIACGLDPEKTTMFIQSQIPEIAELTIFFLNLVTMQKLSHNPTIKTEAMQKGYSLSSRFDDFSENDSQTSGVPMGFLAYPVSQAADILFAKANIIPVGQDQLPVIEQTNDIAKKFNQLYGNVFPEVKAVLGSVARLVGIDGQSKASKSLGNAIMLSDGSDEITKKVMQMYTDPNHLRIEDKGQIKGNVVFDYLDIFDNDKKEVQRLKDHYQKGGLGDVVIKKRLIEVLEAIISPIRLKRTELVKDKGAVMEILKKGTMLARQRASIVMSEVRSAININYF